jgi:sterol desaturase/sphingolipid hydroxylase (fatty acid hydroxylase superfamily)
MERFLQDNEGTVLFLGMVVAIIVAMLLETVYPRRPESPDTNRRWANNIGLTIVNQANINWLTGVVAAGIAWWGEEEGFGLLRGVNLDFWPMLLLAILVFELVAYWFHRAMHAVPWLWRIHAVHHSDTELDVTTTYRNHPLELLVNAPLTIPVILLLGFPIAVVVAYQLLKTSVSVMAHSNIRLPLAADTMLRYVIVTPDYHRLHHCSDRRFTDSNFCAAFPLFDYLFGTARSRPYADHATMELGLGYFRRPEDSRVDRLLLMPFFWNPGPMPEASTRPEPA